MTQATPIEPPKLLGRPMLPRYGSHSKQLRDWHLKLGVLIVTLTPEPNRYRLDLGFYSALDGYCLLSVWRRPTPEKAIAVAEQYLSKLAADLTLPCVAIPARCCHDIPLSVYCPACCPPTAPT